MTALRCTSALLLAALPLGCGGAAPTRTATPAASAEEEPSEDAEATGAQARVGCDVLNERDAPEGDLEVAVRARIVARMAARWDLTVSDAEVAGAFAEVAARNELDAAGMEAALRAQGLDVETFAEGLRIELLALKVMRRGVVAPAPTEAEIDEAYAEEFGSDPNENPDAARILRERLVRRMHADRLAAASAAWLETVTERWAEVETETVDGECVERWPRVEVDALVVEGNEAIETEALLANVQGPTFELGPDQALPPEAHDRMLAAYYELGHLAAQLLPLEREDGQWVLHVAEGPQHRIGEIRIIDEDTGEPRSDARRVARGLPIETGDVFARSQILEALEAVRERTTGAEDAETAVRPETRIHDDIVDLDFVVTH